MNASLIASLSVLLTSAVIGNAFYQKKQFYPSVVYLTKSNASLAVRMLCNGGGLHIIRLVLLHLVVHAKTIP